MTNIEIIKVIKAKIDDEKKYKNEFYKGRRQAFGFVLSYLRENNVCTCPCATINGQTGDWCEFYSVEDDRCLYGLK